MAEFIQILTEAISPRREMGSFKKDNSPLGNIINSLLREAVSPRSQMNCQRTPNNTRSTQNNKGVDAASIAVAVGLKVAGGTIKHLLEERIPDLYKGKPQLAVSPRVHLALPQRSTESKPNGSLRELYECNQMFYDNMHVPRCGVCEEELKKEAVTHLNCGHFFHTKCLYCCYLYLEVEKEGILTCPIQKCRVEIKGVILESILETKI